jgi:hypothetical protein
MITYENNLSLPKHTQSSITRHPLTLLTSFHQNHLSPSLFPSLTVLSSPSTSSTMPPNSGRFAPEESDYEVAIDPTFHSESESDEEPTQRARPIFAHRQLDSPSSEQQDNHPDGPSTIPTGKMTIAPTFTPRSLTRKAPLRRH